MQGAVPLYTQVLQPADAAWMCPGILPPGPRFQAGWHGAPAGAAADRQEVECTKDEDVYMRKQVALVVCAGAVDCR